MTIDDFGDESPAGPKGSNVSEDVGLLAFWERLRIVFNAILGCEVLALTLLARADYWTQRGFIRYLVARAIIANICFCAGPVADGYLRRFGFRGRGPTMLLFGIGTLLSMVAAFASM